MGTADRKKFLLRISPALWDALNRWAAQEFRSVNGQIEFILQRAVKDKFGQSPSKNEPGHNPTDVPRTDPQSENDH